MRTAVVPECGFESPQKKNLGNSPKQTAAIEIFSARQRVW
jgi:hypothetical protein